MKIGIEKKKAEAVKRMKALGIFPQTIKWFEEDGLIGISTPPVGAFFWAEGEDLERIRKFEHEYNALVYVVIRSYMSYGVMDSYLYVSDHPEEWVTDMEDLKANEALAYVFNHAMPDWSEIGSIGIAPTIAAGLDRTW